MKRIIALIMALALVMGLAITVSAAGDAGISISLNNPEGSTVNPANIKYVGYKLLDAEISDAGVSYYMSAADAEKFDVELNEGTD